MILRSAQNDPPPRRDAVILNAVKDLFRLALSRNRRILHGAQNDPPPHRDTVILNAVKYLFRVPRQKGAFSSSPRKTQETRGLLGLFLVSHSCSA